MASAAAARIENNDAQVDASAAATATATTKMHSTTALHTASVAATCLYHQSDYKKSQAKHAIRSPIPKD
jgi:hypothetical protein